MPLIERSMEEDESAYRIKWFEVPYQRSDQSIEDFHLRFSSHTYLESYCSYDTYGTFGGPV